MIYHLYMHKNTHRCIYLFFCTLISVIVAIVCDRQMNAHQWLMEQQNIQITNVYDDAAHAFVQSFLLSVLFSFLFVTIHNRGISEVSERNI